MKKIVSLILIAFTTFQLIGQVNEEKPANNGHHLGLFAGASPGYGLSYRYFKDKVGVQVTTTPIFASNEVHFSVGGEIMNSFARTKYTNFYGYMAYHYNYNKYNDEWDSGSSDDINITSIAGLGVGFELIAGSRVGFNWQLGYAFYYFDKDDWQTMLDGGVGVYYKF